MSDTTTAVDVHLVVCDMDGTLLDPDGRVPDGFWPLLHDMTARGVAFVPASGRQYQSLARLFEPFAGTLSYIAENGAVAVHEGEVLHASVMDRAFVRRAVQAVRAANDDGARLAAVLCRADGAAIESDDLDFVDHAATYCAVLDRVDDLTAHTAGVVKIAICDFDDAATTASEVLEPLGRDHALVVSGAHWLDITGRGVHKGIGVRRIQEELGASAAQTVVFGDYLNDLEMLGSAEYSFAMANAHPEVTARARYRAPSNVDHGVVTVLRDLLA